jgi:hypothetical protein
VTSPLFWLAALVLWVAFAGVYGKVWTARHNKQRRADYARRKGKR